MRGDAHQPPEGTRKTRPNRQRCREGKDSRTHRATQFARVATPQSGLNGRVIYS